VRSRIADIKYTKLLAFVLSIVPQACRRGERTLPPSTTFRATVIDSVRSKAWWSDDDSMFTYLFEVRTAASLDTLRDVVPPLPTIVGDTLVIGLALDDKAATGRTVVVFDVRRRQIQQQRLPADAWPGQFDFAISPDGDHLLYVGELSAPKYPYREAAVIRRRSSGEVVLTGPPWRSCECDSDLHHARWVTADSFEIATGATEGRGWERLSGSVSHRSVHTDTLTAEPKWH